MQRLVRVDVREIQGWQQVHQLSVCRPIALHALQVPQVENTYDTALILHRPGPELTDARMLRGGAYTHLRRKDLGGAPHHLEHFALVDFGSGLEVRQVDTVLMREGLVDGLFLQTRRNEK